MTEREDERDLDAKAFLRAVQIHAFDAAPTRIAPFGQSRLSWELSVPAVRPPIQLSLTHSGTEREVEPTATTTVSPVTTSSYSLVAGLRSLSRVLATQVIEVDMSQCVSGSVTEEDVRQQISPRIDAIIAEHPEVSRRRNDGIEIDYDGLHLSLRLHAKVPNAPNPDINADVLVSFRAERGALRYKMVSYSFDADLPWWADATIWLYYPAWLAAVLAEGNEESLFRVQILAALDDFVAAQQAEAAAQGVNFLSVTARNDRFDVVMCPLDDADDQGRPRLDTRPGAASATDRAPDVD